MAECIAKCSKGVEMMQGDSWPLEIRLTFGGAALDISKVETVEVSVDSLVKTFPAGGVLYDENKGAFAFWPTQEESFKLSGPVKVQARVKFTDGLVLGKDFGTINIVESMSKEVL